MDYDIKASLRHWPLPMARFGLNPYGENLYRIVFAPSRRALIYGEWADGSSKANWRRIYAHIGQKWILEKWLSAYEFSGMTSAMWNASLTVLGSYPDRGEYEHCYTFGQIEDGKELSGPTDSNLEKLIAWIEMGKTTSFSEVRTACRNAYDREEADKSKQLQAWIGCKLPAFGAAAMSGPGGGRGTKTMPILKTAEELNLPTKPGMSRTRRVPSKTFEIPITV